MHDAKFSSGTSKAETLRKYGCWIRNASIQWKKPLCEKKARCRPPVATTKQEQPSGAVMYSLESGQLSEGINVSKILSVDSDDLAEGSYPVQEDGEDDEIESREDGNDIVEEEEEDFEAAFDEDYFVPSDDPEDSDYKSEDNDDSGIESDIPGALHDFSNYDDSYRTHNTRRRRSDEAKAIRKEKRDKNRAELAFCECMSWLNTSFSAA